MPTAMTTAETYVDISLRVSCPLACLCEVQLGIPANPPHRPPAIVNSSTLTVWLARAAARVTRWGWADRAQYMQAGHVARASARNVG
jgi:hypothetical protein